MKFNIVNSILIIVILFFIIDNVRAETPITYLSYIDDGLGFYKVIDLTTHKPSPYEQKTLIINQGDTVTWTNDAENATLTVHSEQKLFSDKRLNVRQRSSYEFDQIGTYTFILNEHSSSHQTIIVNSLEAANTVPTPVPTVSVTKTPITNVPTVVPTVSVTDTPIPVVTNSQQESNIPTLPKISIIQMLSIIVTILSIFITYQVGKNAEPKIKKVKVLRNAKALKKTKEFEIVNNKYEGDIKLVQKILGGMCYSLGFLTGILFILVSGKDNKFVRFHALQSIIIFLSIFIVFTMFDTYPVIATLLFFIGMILWLFLMFRAFQGKIYKFPIIGGIAEKFA